nr:MAG TPA: hypothetical protein [Caudoviricetes sp.]
MQIKQRNLHLFNACNVQRLPFILDGNTKVIRISLYQMPHLRSMCR